MSSSPNAHTHVLSKSRWKTNRNFSFFCIEIQSILTSHTHDLQSIYKLWNPSDYRYSYRNSTLNPFSTKFFDVFSHFWCVDFTFFGSEKNFFFTVAHSVSLSHSAKRYQVHQNFSCYRLQSTSVLRSFELWMVKCHPCLTPYWLFCSFVMHKNVCVNVCKVCHSLNNLYEFQHTHTHTHTLRTYK